MIFFLSNILIGKTMKKHYLKLNFILKFRP